MPEQSKISAYYNLDNGSGKVRGIYMQDNDAVRPIFEAWVAPLHDLGADALTIRATGSTDHTNFDNAGVPGFQFIQDPLEYAPRTHHSNMDVYDRLQDERPGAGLGGDGLVRLQHGHPSGNDAPQAGCRRTRRTWRARARRPVGNPRPVCRISE